MVFISWQLFRVGITQDDGEHSTIDSVMEQCIRNSGAGAAPCVNADMGNRVV
jgi:hypothetical protein